MTKRYDPPRLAEPPAPYRAAAPSQGGACVRPHVSAAIERRARGCALLRAGRAALSGRAASAGGSRRVNCRPSAAQRARRLRSTTIRTTPALRRRLRGRSAERAPPWRSGHYRGGARSGGARHRRRLCLSRHVRRLDDAVAAADHQSRHRSEQDRADAGECPGQGLGPGRATHRLAGEKARFARRKAGRCAGAARPATSAGGFDHSDFPDARRPPQGAWAPGVAGPVFRRRRQPAQWRPRCRDPARPCRRLPRRRLRLRVGVNRAEEDSHRGHPARSSGRSPMPLPPAAASAPASRGRAVPRRAAAAMPRRSAPAGGNGPLSIVPTQGEAAAPAPVRTRTAVAQPMAPAAAPSAAAEAPRCGRRLCGASHVAAQRGRSAVRLPRLAAPNIRPSSAATQPIVRQADLGAKGIYYRALVGPFASMEQAAGMCSSLKAAGGNCIVQRN